MVRVRMRLSGFCRSRGTARDRVKTQSQQCSQARNSVYANDNSIEGNFNGDAMLKAESSKGGNRAMVVVESGLESKDALHWALSHAVQSHDTIVLLHVTKPSKQGATCTTNRAYELLCSMKELCETRRPEVQVEIAVVEGKGKEKGPRIVKEAKQQRVSLLVLGQKKQSMVRLWTVCRGRRTHSRVVEHCIQNANCITIAVRRKSRKYGGYLITTKRHKNFWLLA
ncbi:hypothetical protein C3L33_22396, partial [Rhododendron williamsianum]